MSQPTSREALLAVALLCDRLSGAAPAPATLAQAELRAFSQNGEDGVLIEVLRRIGIGEDPSFVEFGVENGSECCCVLLADVLGWRGVFLEGSEVLHGPLHRKYEHRDDVRTRCVMVTPENVEPLFADLGVPAEPDVLCIDTDGADYWIWRAVTAYRPRVVVIEYNAALPADEAISVPEDHTAGWDGTTYYGASLTAMERLGAAKGYRLVHTELAGVNAFFVREDLAGPFPGPALRRGSNHYLQSLGHPPAAPDRPWVRDPPV